MKEASTNLKDLPTEILYEIFRLAAESDGFNTTRDYALVCKACVIPAQLVLYSNVSINTLPNLRKFYSTVQHIPQLGMMVKTINMEINLAYSIIQTGHGADLEMYDLLTKLLSTCLLNLEEYNEHPQTSYIPVLEALQYSQLTQLKRLCTPEYDLEGDELANYATCVVFMKNRIEKIRIIEKNVYLNERGRTAHRLFSKLHEFNKLTSLQLDRKTSNDIQDLEYVLTSCKSLRELSFDFKPNDKSDANLLLQNDNILEVSNFIPAFHVENLQCAVKVSKECRNLLYIMHKFPHLSYFIFVGKDAEDRNFNAEDNNRIRLDHQTLHQFLVYSRDIKVKNLSVDINSFPETMRGYWDVSEGHGKWDVNIVSLIISQDLCLINISHNPVSNRFTIKYPKFNLIDRYFNWVKKNGIFIKSLSINQTDDEYDRYNTRDDLPCNLIAHTITQCPSIEVIYISYCAFEDSTELSGDLNGKFLLKKLYIDDCDFGYGITTLEKTSLYLYELGELHLDGYFTDPSQNYATPPNIVMKHTDIGYIVFQNVHPDRIIYLKVFAANSSECHYYLFDHGLNVCSEQEYKYKNDETHLTICCQNIPELQFITTTDYVKFMTM